MEQLKVRLPADVKAFIAAQAARNGSSQTSEVIRSIRDRMERVATTGFEIGVLAPVDAGTSSIRETADAAHT